MSELNRTLAFVVAAVLSIGVAVLASPGKPQQPAEFSEVGTEFFPEFKSPADAKGLEVVAFDEETATVRAFVVEYKNGLWRIPSRHNYPADGKDQLAKTANSLIGVKRDVLVGRRESQYEEFGVIDPNEDDATKLKGRGQKITLKNEKGDVLAAFIVGKPVPGQNGYFYVRKVGTNGSDKATYKAKLDIKLSTKFTDWIEPDLLKLEAARLTNITIDKYTVDTNEGRILGKEINELSRAKSTDPWTMAELDETKEELNKDEVQKIVTALDNLKIVGVRPKPAKLSKDLRLDEGISLDQATMFDLGTKGFMFTRGESGGARLISKEGDLVASTDQGATYVLHFGEVFSGTEEDIEVGGSAAAEPAAEKELGPKEEKAGSKKSRYLFVTAQFDAEKLGPEPTPPTKPTEPTAEEIASAQETPATGDTPANSQEGAGKIGPEAEYKQALARYELETRAYEGEVKGRKTKIEEGEKLVKDLNARFADWYYVIDAESFDNLRQGRKTLVKAKATGDAAATDAAPANDGLPSITPGQADPTEPTEVEAAPGDAKPEE